MKTIILRITFLLLAFLPLQNCSESYYFDFDKILHYKIEEIDIKKEPEIGKILYERYPSGLNDSKFLNNLDSMELSVVDSSHFSKIRNIFKEKSCSSIIEKSCIPVYRDILVFYKNNEIIGIAKICFDCNVQHIIGTKEDTSYFGQCGDYDLLNEILN